MRSMGLKNMARKNRPHTPDGRYLVSKGILKRCTNPKLDDSIRRQELKALMQARMAKDKDAALKAKIALGEAGPVWWEDDTTDDAKDYSNQQPMQTPYAKWWQSLSEAERLAGE